jgi:phosphoglycerol transferase MdoB-like AlkP superfamily enzyme
MTSFPNYETAFDGTWGIPDEPFLKFFADDLNKKTPPFFSTIFTLSSHHPYKIPEQYTGKFKKGKHPILEAVGYTDYALRQFFKKAKKQTWYNNTLFIITADHTSYRINETYDNKVGALKVPIAFYKPNDLTLKGEQEEVFQQIDIMPTILEWVGYDKPYFSFGSPFSNKSNRRAVFGKDLFQMIKGDYILLFNGRETKGLYNYKKDPQLKTDLSLTESETRIKIEQEIKAFRQLYNNRIIYNQMTP